MSGTERRQMNVIKKPAEGTRSVLVGDGEDPFIIGDGPLTFVCGGCRWVVIDGAGPGQVQAMVFRCKKCGAYNETLD